MDMKKSRIEFMLAWRNVWKNKRRTILTLLTIMVGCAMIIFFKALQEGGYEKMIDDAIAANTGHIQIHEKGFWENMSIDYAFKPGVPLLVYLRKNPAVSAVSRRVYAAGLVSYQNNTFGVLVQAVDPGQEKKVSTLHTTIQSGGRYITPDDGKKIIMGATLAKNMNGKGGGD